MSVPTAPQPSYRRGDILIVPFPSSSVGAPAKKRPAVVMAVVSFGADADYLCALITSQAAPDPTRIMLSPADVQGGTLTMQSYLRPLYLYTASQRSVAGKIGMLAPARLAEAVQVLKSQVDPGVQGA